MTFHVSVPGILLTSQEDRLRPLDDVIRGTDKAKTGREIRPSSGIGLKPISVLGTKRLVRKALERAVRQRACPQ